EQLERMLGQLRQEHREDTNRGLPAGISHSVAMSGPRQPWVQMQPTPPAMPPPVQAAVAPSSSQQRRPKHEAPGPRPPTVQQLDPSQPLESAEELVARLQAGGEDAETALVNVLEVGLEVLEAVLVSTPRKQRKVVKQQCERVEAMLEEVDEHLLERLVAYDGADLAQLGAYLAAMQALRLNADVGVECVTVVADALDELGRCGDVVAGASRQLTSADVRMRLRGADALRNLPRVHLPEPSMAEVAAASLVVAIAQDEGKTDGERTAAYWSLFALGLRNGAAAVDALATLFAKGPDAEVGDGRLQGREGVAVWVGATACAHLAMEVACQCPSVRGQLEQAQLATAGNWVNIMCPKARYQELLPLLLTATAADDVVEASAAAVALSAPLYWKTAPECRGVFLQCDPARVGWELRRRVIEPGLPATRWRELAQSLSVDTVCLQLLSILIGNVAGLGLLDSVPHDGVWPEIISEAVHLANVNRDAKLSAQEQFSFFNFYGCFSIISSAAKDPKHHPALMPCAEALLWAISNVAFQYLGINLAEASANACVSLLGKNEGGLTLDKAAVAIVLQTVHRYFDTSPTADWLTKMSAREKSGKAVAGAVQLVVDMVIADASELCPPPSVSPSIVPAPC
ncbi:MAG: hypothetical protein OSB57_15075, partial [Planctomycetota bacterium]|nr:hypothetical protein [Planctomycetota bacterium]